jgi:hypothetical protein
MVIVPLMRFKRGGSLKISRGTAANYWMAASPAKIADIAQ